MAAPEASSPENFGTLIQNTDPGSNAGIPGLQLPAGLGASTGLPVGLELDGIEHSVRVSRRRAWRLRFAVEELLKRRTVAGPLLEVLIGHSTSGRARLGVRAAAGQPSSLCIVWSMTTVKEGSVCRVMRHVECG